MVKFLRRHLPCGTHYGIGIICLTEAGEQQIDWDPDKDWNHPDCGDAKNYTGDAKNMADKSNKINIFILREAV